MKTEIIFDYDGTPMINLDPQYIEEPTIWEKLWEWIKNDV